MSTSNRYITTDLKVRTSEDGKGPLLISGFASVETRDDHGTIIKSDGLKLDSFKSNPQGFFNHGMDPVFGTTPAIGWDPDSIKLTQDAEGRTGLFMEGIVWEDTEEQRKIASFIRQGSVKFLSIGFSNARSEWIQNDDGSTVETITSAELKEVSAVTLPSNSEASIDVVSRQIEKRLSGLEAAVGLKENTNDEEYEVIAIVAAILGNKES